MTFIGNTCTLIHRYNVPVKGRGADCKQASDIREQWWMDGYVQAGYSKSITRGKSIILQSEWHQ